MVVGVRHLLVQKLTNYSCQSSYKLVGLSERVCLDNGFTIFCAIIFVVSCPSLIPPASGSLTISSEGTRTVANYTCLSDYKLLGSAERVCSEDGVWDSTDPVCGERHILFLDFFLLFFHFFL